MPTIIFTLDGSIEVTFPPEITNMLPYVVMYGHVALTATQAERAQMYGWDNLGRRSNSKILAAGLVEVHRSIITYTQMVYANRMTNTA